MAGIMLSRNASETEPLRFPRWSGQLVPQRSAGRVGILTGLVGAAGSLGGFFLPFLLAAVRQRTGQYSVGLRKRSIFFIASRERLPRVQELRQPC